jgi:hypothetical protein
VAPAAAPAKVNALGVPELDPNIAFWVAEDAQGNLVERPGSPPGMLAAYQQHQRSYGQFLKKFASDPAAALAPLLATIKAEAAKEARESVMTEAQRAAQGRSADQIIQQNSNWAFEKDAAGNPVVVVDHLTGQQNYKYTEGGQLWVGHVQTLQKAGLTDPATIDKYAQAMTFFDTYRAANPPGAPAAAPGTAPAAPAAPAAPTNASLKDAFLNRIPGQNPSGIPAPPGSSAVPQSRKLSLSEQMMQDLAKAGYDGVTKLPMGQTQAA